MSETLFFYPGVPLITYSGNACTVREGFQNKSQTDQRVRKELQDICSLQRVSVFLCIFVKLMPYYWGGWYDWRDWQHDVL